MSRRDFEACWESGSKRVRLVLRWANGIEAARSGWHRTHMDCLREVRAAVQGAGGRRAED